MAAAFMAQRVPLRNSGWLVVAALLLAQCKGPDRVVDNVQVPETIPNTAQWVPSSDTALQRVADIMYHNGKLFTGMVYALYLGTADTAFINGFWQGREHGYWKKYYPGHRQKERRQYNNGQKTGELLAWWPDGKLQLAYTFNGGEYEGDCREWDTSGTLIKAMHYRAGHEEGAQKMFYNNGKIRSNYVVINGRRYGLLGTKNCINVTDSIFKN
jgi:antitoxin component YwqK of YwqJK toxin-antitoxin module